MLLRLDSLFKKKIKEEVKKEDFLFKINFDAKKPILPDVEDETKLDLRYGLIVPYAYAHLYWDDVHGEVVYGIEEPNLDVKEKEVLNTLEQGIQELIGISFINVDDKEVLIEYLEKNVQVLLKELNIGINRSSYLKLMYYIYRDFIGLNKIEPLMNDFYIEDIECNGVKTPVYLVHRRFGNIRTNIVYDDFDEITSFVEKLSQKCGKYISYANPIMDGRLPDSGARVNATYTEDVTSRGPTFSIRMFTREAWSPVKLMNIGTASAEVLAYLWILVEHGTNILVVGGTGSGKTTMINVIASFIRPEARIVSIEDSVCGDAEIIIREDNNLRKIKIGDLIDDIKDNGAKFTGEILTLDKEYKLKFVKPSAYLRHKVKKDIYRITTSTGRQVKVTGDHSLFTLGEKGLIEIKPTELVENKNFIAVPRYLPVDGTETKFIHLRDYLNIFKDEFLVGTPLKKLFEKYKRSDLNIGKSKYQWWISNNIIKIDKFLETGYKFSGADWDNIYLKTKLGNKFSERFYLTDSFLNLIGLWLGDGSYDNYNANRVIISNSDSECQDLVRKIAKDLDLNISIMNDGISLTLNSCILYKIMKYVLELDGYSSTKRIPNIVFNLSNRQLMEVLKGYYSADGTTQKYEVSCTSQSYGLLEDLQTILLRLNIISRIQHSVRRDNCKSLTISSFENLNLFREIGFLQKRKNLKLERIGLKKATHANSDIVPLRPNHTISLNLPWSYKMGIQNIGREHLQRIAPEGSLFNDISHSDILWDKIVKIEKINLEDRYVYDLSVLGTEKFICSNIILHNTKELRLIHENWLPSVARAGTGVGADNTGEITLFDLLRASFRQRPDYVIVGEIRGQEANVLFQGMASGHSGLATMHADDVKTVIKRLETPPINLSPSLVEILDVVCLVGHAKVKGQEMRKLRTIQEIIRVGEGGDAEINVPFQWDAGRNVFLFKRDSVVFKKIVSKRGVSMEELWREFETRRKLLNVLYKKNIIEFEEVQKIINDYYKNKDAVMKRFLL